MRLKKKKAGFFMGITLTVRGNPPSKSNQYLIVRNRLLKSKNVLEYENNFLYQTINLRHLKNKFQKEDQLSIKLEVFLKNNRQDLDGVFKIIFDCLQKNNFIVNDNQIHIIEAVKFIDKENQRINIEISKIC